jgi:hypothetical protein
LAAHWFALLVQVVVLRIKPTVVIVVTGIFVPFTLIVHTVKVLDLNALHVNLPQAVIVMMKPQMLDEIHCDMPWDNPCGRLAVNAFLFGIKGDTLVLYRCDQHQLRLGSSSAIKCVSLEEAIIVEAINS